MSATRLLWAQVAPKFGPFIPHRLPLSTIGASLPRLGNFAPLPVPFVSTRRVSPIANMKAPGIGLGNVRTLFISSQDRLSGRVGHSLAGTSFLGPLATLAKPNSSSPFLRFRSTWHNQAARRPSGSSRAAATPKQSSYKTPSLNYFDRNPSYLIYLIIGICTAVFLAWQYAQQSWQKFGDRSLANFMANNFLCSWDGVMAGRWWTLLTSTFSHNERECSLLSALCVPPSHCQPHFLFFQQCTSSSTCLFFTLLARPSSKLSALAFSPNSFWFLVLLHPSSA